MTPQQWSSVTDLLNELIEQPSTRPVVLAAQPEEICNELERLLLANEALGHVPPAAGPKRVIRQRYELKNLLGAGGSGDAWLGQDLQTGDLVVLKLARNWDWFRADLRRRFLSEIEILQSVDHAGIIRILDSGETEQGAPFLVMPFINGPTLRSLLDIGSLNSAAASSIVEQLGAAVAAAHACNVTHRDIKPENVMLQSRPNGSYHLFLIDFGIALFSDLEREAGATTRFFGTTRYMAPEQLLGQPVCASDTYALALVAYEMLSDAPLFQAETPVALYNEEKQLKESRMSVKVPPSVRRLLLEALRPDPAKRPADLRAFTRKLAAEIRQPGVRLPSRRQVLRVGLTMSTAAVGAAAWWLQDHAPPTAVERTIRYQAGQTFAAVGWKKVGHIDEDITLFDQYGNIIGNSLVSEKGGGYYFPFPKRVERAGLARKWRAAWSVRPGREAAFAICFRQHRLRFVGAIRRPKNQEPSVRLIKSYFPKIEDIRAPLKLSGNGFVRIEMRFNPEGRRVSLLVDGQPALDGYAGTSQFLEVPGISIGFGEAVFGNISFAMD